MSARSCGCDPDTVPPLWANVQTAEPHHCEAYPECAYGRELGLATTPEPPRTIEIYVDTLGRAKCTGKNCRKEILWGEIVGSGRKMCFDDPALVALTQRLEPGTNRRIYGFPARGNHWAVCPDRDRFKR